LKTAPKGRSDRIPDFPFAPQYVRNPTLLLVIAIAIAPSFARASEPVVDIVRRCAADVGGSVYAGLVPTRGGVIAVTMTDRAVSISNDCKQRWATNLGQSRIDYPNFRDRPLWYKGPVGCLSTPAVDSKYLYAVCATTGQWILHKLRLTDGQELGSVVISATAPIVFAPAQHTNRSGLLLYRGRIYIGFGGFSDILPYHGWLFAYDAATLTQAAVYCTTLGGFGGGIWMSGASPSVDEHGNVWIATGNGDVSSLDHSQSILELSPNLRLLASYTTPEWEELNRSDADLGSTGVLLTRDRVIVGSKDFKIRSIRRDCMCLLVTTALRGAPRLVDHEGIYEAREWGGRTFAWSTIGNIVSDSATSATYGQAAFTIDHGVVWAITGKRALYSPQHATLRELDSATLREIWHADLGSQLSKYTAPTVVSGVIYAPTLNGKIHVFAAHK